MSDMQALVRRELCSVLRRADSEAAQLDLGQDLKYAYGLGSLDLIMLMSSLCEKAGLDIGLLDEDDIARLNTPADIADLLAAKAAA